MNFIVKDLNETKEIVNAYLNHIYILKYVFL